MRHGDGSYSRCFGVLTAALLFVLTAISAEAQSARVSLIGQPEFYTCLQQSPLPATAPPGIRNAIDKKIRIQCGAPDADRSGRNLVFSLSNRGGPMPAGKNIIQRVRVRSITWKMNNATGKCDRRVPASFSITEYFSHPAGGEALDHHIGAECCELYVKERVSIRTSILPLPATAQPPVPDFGGVGRPYQTAPQLKAVNRQIRANTSARWGYRYEYDQCNTPLQTTTGTAHYLKLKIGSFGSNVYTN